MESLEKKCVFSTNYLPQVWQHPPGVDEVYACHLLVLLLIEELQEYFSRIAEIQNGRVFSHNRLFFQNNIFDDLNLLINAS